MERMPSSLPSLSTTGRWRKWRSTMVAIASAGPVCSVAISTGVVIRSRTGVDSGSGRSGRVFEGRRAR